MSPRALFLFVIMCLVGGAACSKGVPVRNPDPFVAASTENATEVAILEALPKRRWTAEEVTPGRIIAFLPIKGFLVRAEIVYDAQRVQIRYLSSDNLGERVEADGQVYAHGNVNKWLRNLALTIARAMGTQSSVALAGPSASGSEVPATPELGSALAPEATPAP